MWSKSYIEKFMEQIHSETQDDGVFCRGCRHNEKTVDHEPYGDGTAERVTYECILDAGYEHCPGVIAGIFQAVTYIETRGAQSNIRRS